MNLTDAEIRKLADQYDSDARDADELGITRSKNFNERNAFIARLALSRGEAIATLTSERDALRWAVKTTAEYIEDDPVWNAIVPTGKPDIRDETQTLGHVIEAALALASPAAPTSAEEIKP